MNTRTAALLTAAAVLMSTGIVLMHEDVKGELIEVATVLLPGLQEAPSAEVPTGVTLDDLAPCGSLRTGDLVFRRGGGGSERRAASSSRLRVPTGRPSLTSAWLFPSIP